VPDRSPRAGTPLVYAVGTTVHARGEELTVHGPRVAPDTVVRVRGQAGPGWLASLEQPRGGPQTHGRIDATGRFRPWPITAFVGEGTAVLSPDGSQVLATQGGRTRVLDVSTGAAQATVPPGRAVAWAAEGVYLLRGGRTTARAWDPDGGMLDRTFDTRACGGATTTAVRAALTAGWDTCRRPGLVAATATGEGLFLAAPLSGGVRLTTRTGVPLLPRLHDGQPGRQRLEGAAFVDADRVALSLSESTHRGAVSVFVTCMLATGACEQVTDPVLARQGPGAAFLVSPPCEDEGRGSML
jgi:hypothetical protein